MRSKTLSVESAVEFIADGDTIAVGGCGFCCLAEEVLVALESRFMATGKPANLTLMHAAGQGDWKGAGTDHLGHEGLIRRIIGGHLDTMPKINALIRNNKIQGYNFPQGVICHLYRAIASGKPGEITKIGLRTFVDPRLEGGRTNACTTEELVQVIDVNGAEYLLYPSLPIQVAIIRGTTADEMGNVTMEDEAVFSDCLAIAQAAKVSGGKVIVQVKHLTRNGSLNAQMVRIPGILVDAIVVSREPAQYHRQTGAVFFNPTLSGQVKIPVSAIPVRPMDEKKIVARRAAMELKDEGIINLGIGAPEAVAAVATEEDLLDHMTMTIEMGPIGGIPTSNLDYGFGAAINPLAILDQPSQFDFYNGGGLDVAFLGMAQADSQGNVNVSRFGSRLAGCGGFINISQSTKNVVFCGKFTNGGLKTEIADGRLRIVREGREKKFVQAVQQVTFSAACATASGQRVLYVTERAVFALRAGRMTLIEVAPGVDLERDILTQMDFRPEIADDLKPMDPVIFTEGQMGLLRKWAAPGK